MKGEIKMEWAKEKAYCQKRAEELKQRMIEATIACDADAFRDALHTALRYMSARELRNMKLMFYSHMMN